VILPYPQANLILDVVLLLLFLGLETLRLFYGQCDKMYCERCFVQVFFCFVFVDQRTEIILIGEQGWANLKCQEDLQFTVLPFREIK